MTNPHGLSKATDKASVIMRTAIARHDGCRVFINDTRTLFVELWPSGELVVATRDHPSHVWGPPETLTEQTRDKESTYVALGGGNPHTLDGWYDGNLSQEWLEQADARYRRGPA